MAAVAVAGSVSSLTRRPTRIQVLGNTVLGTSATYEVVLFQPSVGGASGTIFKEHTVAAENKLLYAGIDLIIGNNYASTSNAQLERYGPQPVGRCVAPHRLRPGRIQQRTAHLCRRQPHQVRACQRRHPGWCLRSVHWRRDASTTPPSSAASSASCDSVRISNNARYTGSSFTPTIGDLADDDNALILYNFNAGDFVDNNGIIEVTDVSGNGNTGRFGQGLRRHIAFAPRWCDSDSHACHSRRNIHAYRDTNKHAHQHT